MSRRELAGRWLRAGGGYMVAGWPGLLSVATIAMAAGFIANQHGGPTLLYALLLGIAFNFLGQHERTAPGVDLAARSVLRIGVALLGARIGLEEIAGLGWAPVAVLVAAVILIVTVGTLVAKRLGLTRDQGILTGGAVGICGASAALALAAVLPQDRTTQRTTLVTVVGVTALGSATMIAYPLLVNVLEFDDRAAGIFLGGTIHDVAQVVGAGYIVSEPAGDTATITKLVRVAMLVPVVLVVAVLVSRGGHGAGPLAGRLPVPLFLVAFVALAAANSFGLLAAPVQAVAANSAMWCLIGAIAAVGIKTDFRELATIGWRPVALLLAETVLMTLFILAAIAFGVV